MTKRWMAVVLGAAVLAVPGTALAKGGPHGKDKAESHAKAHKHLQGLEDAAVEC
jgi:hypothetical protein